MWKGICLLTLAVWLASAAAQDSTATAIQDDLDALLLLIQNPIYGTVILLVNIVCQPLKAILVNQNQAPDLSGLNLQYRNSTTVEKYNLTTFANDISSQPGYNPSATISFFVPGYTDNPTKTNSEEIAAAFEQIGEKNIYILDTATLISYDYLTSATKYIRYIGDALGQVFAALYRKGQLASSFICVGHSLGAHICSFAAKTFLALTGVLLGRISGLDPAGPCFPNVPASMKLSPNDAAFVDAIHTNRFVFGINENDGMVNFYPNGGADQPGCDTPSCSHSRVVALYAESVTSPNAFIGIACGGSYLNFVAGNCDQTDLSVMGYSCPSTARGVYYLQTASTSPYGLGTDGTTYTPPSLI